MNIHTSALNFKSFFQSLEQFFLTAGQNNFCNKIPFTDLFISIKYFLSDPRHNIAALKSIVEITVLDIGCMSGLRLFNKSMN